MSREEDKEFEAEGLKSVENGEIYHSRPLPQEEKSESSAESSENAASAKRQLNQLRSVLKDFKTDEQYESYRSENFKASTNKPNKTL